MLCGLRDREAARRRDGDTRTELWRRPRLGEADRRPTWRLLPTPFEICPAPAQCCGDIGPPAAGAQGEVTAEPTGNALKTLCSGSIWPPVYTDGPGCGGSCCIDRGVTAGAGRGAAAGGTCIGCCFSSCSSILSCKGIAPARLRCCCAASRSATCCRSRRISSSFGAPYAVSATKSKLDASSASRRFAVFNSSVPA